MKKPVPVLSTYSPVQPAFRPLKTYEVPGRSPKTTHTIANDDLLYWQLEPSTPLLPMLFAIPLAWLQLTREKIRLLVALAGIGFAVILMFMQLGFRNALFDSAVTMHKALEGDIFFVSPQSTALIAMKSFSQRRLYQALGVEGVESITPIYLDFRLWKNPQTCNTRGIMVIGFDPDSRILNLPATIRDPETGALNEQVTTADILDQVKVPDVVLFDELSRSEFVLITPPARSKFNGVPQCLPSVDTKTWQRLQDPETGFKTVRDWFQDGTLLSTEVGGRRVQITGLFKLGASFGADGNVITSDLNFRRIFDQRKKGIIDVGLIKLEPGADLHRTLALIKQELSGVAIPVSDLVLPQDPKELKALEDYVVGDVRVFSKEQFIAFEMGYWQDSTAIGFIFTLGTAMGFIVGTVIVYQILYTDVTDHLPEYATLKAMGYRNLYLEGVVFQEALILAVLGYIPGFTLCLGLYDLTRNATSLPMQMTWDLAVLVFVLTVVMCCISGAIAVRKAQGADPADIF